MAGPAVRSGSMLRAVGSKTTKHTSALHLLLTASSRAAAVAAAAFWEDCRQHTKLSAGAGML